MCGSIMYILYHISIDFVDLYWIISRADPQANVLCKHEIWSEIQLIYCVTIKEDYTVMSAIPILIHVLFSCFVSHNLLLDVFSSYFVRL